MEINPILDKVIDAANPTPNNSTNVATTNIPKNCSGAICGIYNLFHDTPFTIYSKQGIR